MLELYQNIRKYRKNLKMSQDELAKRAGYTDRSSIAKIEKGQVDLSQSKIRMFAAIFGVTPGELMGNDGIDQTAFMFEIDPTPYQKIAGRALEEQAPGLTDVMNMYVTFNEQDRQEILTLMQMKYQKYQQ